MATGLASFFVDIGIHGDTLTLKNMVNMMSDLKIESLAQLDVLSHLKESFKDVFNEALKHGTKLEAMNEAFGLDPKVIQNWENVAKIIGGTAEDADSTMKGMQSSLDQAREGHPSEGYLQGMSKLGLAGKLTGVNKAEDLFAILLSRIPEYVNEHKGGPGGERAAVGDVREFLRMAGMSNEVMLRILLGGTGRFNNLAGQIRPISDQDVKNWADLNVQINILIGKWEAFIRVFESSVIPYVLKGGQEALNLANGTDNTNNTGYAPWLAGAAGTAAVLGTAVGAGATVGPGIAGLAILAGLLAETASASQSRKAQETLNQQIDIYFHGGETNHLAHEIVDKAFGKVLAHNKAQVQKATTQFVGPVQR